MLERLFTASGDRLTQLATHGAIAFSVMLPLSQFALFQWVEPTDETATAAVLTAAVVALSLWHVSYGLRGGRPPYAPLSLALMLVVVVAGEAAFGAAWGLMFASVAASALIVLRTPWSLLAFGALLVAVGLLGDADLGLPGGYLVGAVSFRAVTLFVLVWIVAATWRLAQARVALAEQAVVAERSRIEDELGDTLAVALERLAEEARLTRNLIDGEDFEAARRALESLVARSRTTFAGARETVADYRQSTPSAELETVSRLLLQDKAGRSR
jgi:hypothetical protein